MNCPNCGAKNDADARFCAECGTPLDDVVVETAKVEQVFDETSEDMTIMSASGGAAAGAKTLAVDQAKVVAVAEDIDNAETVDDDDSASEPESSPPSPSSPATADAGGGDQNGDGMDPGGGDGDSGGSNRTLIIVGVIVLVFLLLCCCCSVLIGVAIGSDPGAIEDLIEEIAMLSVYLSFI